MRRFNWRRGLAAVLGIALFAAVGAAALPDNPYQRFQLVENTLYDNIAWAYERMHFDPRPIDVAIVGPSRTRLGISAGRVEEALAKLGKPADVANFSIVADGRNVEWAILDEMFRAGKKPKVIVVSINEEPNRWGHPSFKFVAPASAIVAPPAPFLHNSLYDIMYLPFRQLKLFAASLLPGVFGRRTEFDPALYARTRSDFTTSHRLYDGRWIEMEGNVPRATLLAKAKRGLVRKKDSRVPKGLTAITDADDRVYVEEIAKLAKSHGVPLVFLFIPTFNGETTIVNRAFYAQYGRIIDFGDFVQQDKLYQGWAHLNRAGALIASDRLAAELAPGL